MNLTAAPRPLAPLVVAILLAFTFVSGCRSGSPTHPTPAAEALPEYYDKQYPDSARISTVGPVIPGLTEGMIPQGLAYWPEQGWLITSNYIEGGKPSTLMIIDVRTQKLIKRLNLYQESGAAYTGHAGGIAVSRSYLWVASGGSLHYVPLQAVRAAPHDGKLSFAGRFSTVTRASFASYADGVLWVGDFYHPPDYPTAPSQRLTNRDGATYSAWIAGYTLESVTDLPASARWSTAPAVPPDVILSVTDRIQGMAITESQIILSQSYGRTKDSALLKYAKPDLASPPHQTVSIGGQTVPVWFLDSASRAPNLGVLTLPPMSEGIAVDEQGQLYVLFESAATKYRATASAPLDRIRIIRLADWARAGR